MKHPLLTFLFVAVTSIFAERVHAQLVIANPSVKAADASKAELKDVFSGAASSLKDGSHVAPVLPTRPRRNP